MTKFDAIQKECQEQIAGYLEFELMSMGMDYFGEYNGKFRALSPIEEIFAYVFNAMRLINYSPLKLPIEMYDKVLRYSRIELHANKKIFGKSGNYYFPDFTFSVESESEKKQLQNDLKLLIELDGYIWHEKSPEQVQKDKTRERDLISNDYTLLRYTGKDLYEKPFVVVGESLKLYIERVIKNNG